MTFPASTERPSAPAAKLRVALIGFGQIAQAYARDPNMRERMRYATHAQVLGDHPAFAWEAVVDVQPERLKEARSDWGVERIATTPAGLEGRDDIDVVVLATPPDPAGRVEVLDAFPNLRAVIVEKPLGRDLAAARHFLAACRARALPVQVNITRRGDATVRALASGGLEASVGPIQAAFGIYGNGVANNGTHMIDLVRMLLGEIAFVQASPDARAGFVEGPIPDDRNVPFLLWLERGLCVPFAPVRFAHYRETSLDLWGERGRLTYAHGGFSIQLRGLVTAAALSTAFEVDDGPGERLPNTLGDALYALYDNVAETLAGRATLVSPGDSALRTAEIVEAIVESDRAGGVRIRC